MRAFRLISKSLGVFFLVLSIGCSSGSSNSAASKSTIKIDGSTALQPLVASAATDYMAQNADVTVMVAGGGSGKGLTDVGTKAVDIGDSDVQSDVAGLIDHQVAVNPFSIIHGPNIDVNSLTKKQIASIFTKAVTNWKQVGGRDQAVVLVNRPLGSGTRKVFTNYILGGTDQAAQGTIIDSSEDLARYVKNHAGTVSYVALAAAQKYNVGMIAIDHVIPSTANIYNRSYGFWAFEHMYTTKDSSPQSEAFITFVKSQNAAMDRLGFLAIKDLAQR